jgi:hypothetical protein
MVAELSSFFTSRAGSRSGPAPYSESAYRVLDQAGDAASGRGRAKLAEWFARLPLPARRDIHAGARRARALARERMPLSTGWMMAAPGRLAQCC